ncbi:MAG: addiction module protein [Thermoleophilia bacterium]
MTIAELKREALQLDPSTRAGLARDLLVSLDDLSEAEVERLWLEEAVRRDEEMASGKEQPIPMDEVFAELRSAPDSRRPFYCQSRL